MLICESVLICQICHTKVGKIAQKGTRKTTLAPRSGSIDEKVCLRFVMLVRVEMLPYECDLDMIVSVPTNIVNATDVSNSLHIQLELKRRKQYNQLKRSSNVIFYHLFHQISQYYLEKSIKKINELRLFTIAQICQQPSSKK